MRIATLGLLALLAATVAGCGGGGGGGDSASTEPTPAPPAQPPVQPPESAFTLSGTITASTSQAVDSDTNDPTRESIRNNTFATAQPIPNPITLGGYINQPGSGAPGQSQSTGDTDDVFIVDLLAGQTITMLVADFVRADADLFLFNQQGQLVDFSVSVTDFESITVQEDGRYLVNVFAFAGGTNYILAIGAPGTPSIAPSRAPEIVPWQAVVEYRGSSVISEAESVKRIAGKMGMRERGGGPGRARLMAMDPKPADPQQTLSRLGNAADKSKYITNALRPRWETMQAIKALRQDPQVQWAEPNYKVRSNATTNDEFLPLQWHFPLIGIQDAWEYTTGDSDVVVAVVDTGVLSGHPDLQGQLVAGFDFVRDIDNAGDGDGIDADPEEPGDRFSGVGSHGTHVTGTVVALGDNQIGVAGAAYGATVMPLRALGVDGSGTTFDVDQAIRYAAGLPNDSGTLPDRPADIINLSLGGGPFSQATQNLFDQVRAQGVMVVAAAGNESSTQPSYPAGYNNVLSVSAVDIQRQLAPYSNRGPSIDLAAPGGNSSVDQNGDGFPDGVLSTTGEFNGQGVNFVYAFFNGTSMASPHVAAVLALMKSINPNLTPEDIDALLISGALTDDLGTAGKDDTYGYGLINAQSAVLAAIESTGVPPTEIPRLTASSSTLNFGSAQTELELVLRNGGLGALELLSLTASEDWLTLTPLDTAPSGLGTYAVTVNRSALPTGIFAADIVAQSSVNTVIVRAFASVAGEGASADVGVLYILLFDPETGLTIDQFIATGDDGEYPFEFTNVEPGEYEILAGSDADNDLFICDAGEACGAWLTVDQPIRLQVDSDLTALDFPVEFQVSLPTLSTSVSSAKTETLPRDAVKQKR
ncbi:MAG: S8 family serine peptidase [Pseudomonadota bacterium]